VTRFHVVMTAPGLAAAAVALLERAGCELHYMPPFPSAEAVADLTGRVRADAILSRQGRVTAAAIAASTRLRIVARPGVGADDVDVAAAAARGVLVTRAPGSNSRAVAEHTLALLLALAKNLKPLGAVVAAGGWRGATTKVRDVAGLRLAVLGFGAIGQAVARLARAFDMTVTALGPTAPDAAFTDTARATSLPALLAGADVLSLHCPLTPETRGLIDARALAALPPSALLINTARGAIVDEAALLAALDSGRLAGAGLDVFAEEPPAPGLALRRHPRVIATPHIAGVTDRSLETMGMMAAECIVAALTGGKVPADRIVAL
jgi:D-3-phosphoglycerate dehydrogenase